MQNNIKFTTKSFGEIEMQEAQVRGNYVTYITSHVLPQKASMIKWDNNVPSVGKVLQTVYKEIDSDLKNKFVDTGKGFLWIPALDDVMGDKRFSVFSKDMNATRIRKKKDSDKRKGSTYWLSSPSIKQDCHSVVDVDGGILDAEKNSRALDVVFCFTMKNNEEVRL